jgi:hypothetical protein
MRSEDLEQSAEHLTGVLEGEKEGAAEFQPVHFHYIEISQILFDW